MHAILLAGVWGQWVWMPVNGEGGEVLGRRAWIHRLYGLWR